MEVSRMCPVRECHERQKVPVIVDCWIGPLRDAEPALNLGTSEPLSVSDACRLGRVLGAVDLAWWKPTTQTMGEKLVLEAIAACRQSVRRKLITHPSRLILGAQIIIMGKFTERRSSNNAQSRL